MTNFKIKNLEDLEDKEKWENIFAHKEMHLGSPLSEISNSYKKINLDNSLWENIYKDMKRVHGVSKVEYDWKWVKDKLIPNIENGIKQIKKNKDKFEEHSTILVDFAIETLEAILKVAKTCVKYKRPMEITI